MADTQSGVCGHCAVLRVALGSKFEAEHAVHLHEEKEGKPVLDWERMWTPRNAMRGNAQQVK